MDARKDVEADVDSRPMNGAESLLRTLVDCGVELCLANPGTSEMHFVTALDRVPGMRAVLGLFEGVVTGAADGYARMAGKPAATLLHLGPGLANGLANLHNARKGGVPVVNIIGDHATYHQRYDAPLTSDVKAYANTVSHWTVSSREARDVAADAARAVQAAQVPPGQIASLILPADTAWNEAQGPARPLPVPRAPEVAAHAIDAAVAALQRGKTALLLRGAVLHGRGLTAAAKIATATGARLLADTFTPRIERGAGRATVERMPYRAAQAVQSLAGLETLILVGTQAPIGFFAYPGQPSEFTPPGCRVLALAHPHEDGVAALEAVAAAFRTDQALRLTPFAPSAVPSDGPLTNVDIARVVSHFLPDQAIVVDEGITSSFSSYQLLETAAPFDALLVPGGAIGGGMPLATGAALACPDRKVVNLQADGSGMYTLQSLWTQAREKLDVTTVIYANRAYRVLIDELQGVGAGNGGPKALSMFDIGNPDLDWVKLAEGMGVEAVRTNTVTGFANAFRSAISGRGPRLIEAVI